jgi:hypothetical protein
MSGGREVACTISFVHNVHKMSVWLQEAKLSRSMFKTIPFTNVDKERQLCKWHTSDGHYCISFEKPTCTSTHIRHVWYMYKYTTDLL